jgi:hypothetical protein
MRKSSLKVQKYVGRRKKEGRQVYKKRPLRYGWPATNGHLPAMARSLSDYGLAPFFLFFWFFLKKNLVVWRWAWHFEKMGVQHPHFLELAPTLGRVKSSISHGAWRFHFSFNFFSSIFSLHLDLHIHYRDFSFMKN